MVETFRLNTICGIPTTIKVKGLILTDHYDDHINIYIGKSFQIFALEILDENRGEPNIWTPGGVLSFFLDT